MSRSLDRLYELWLTSAAPDDAFVIVTRGGRRGVDAVAGHWARLKRTFDPRVSTEEHSGRMTRWSQTAIDYVLEFDGLDKSSVRLARKARKRGLPVDKVFDDKAYRWPGLDRKMEELQQRCDAETTDYPPQLTHYLEEYMKTKASNVAWGDV